MLAFEVISTWKIHSFNNYFLSFFFFARHSSKNLTYNIELNRYTSSPSWSLHSSINDILIECQ